MRHFRTITVDMILVAVFAISCSRPSGLSYHWNESYEYGTLYPSFMGNIDYAQNGKGFSIENNESKFCADCYLIGLDDEGEEIYPVHYIHDDKGPVIITDTVYYEGNDVVLDKVVAYNGINGPMFYEIYCRYPENKADTYKGLLEKCVSEFPYLTKNEVTINRMHSIIK